ncbi:MAG: 3-phenylpropionate MFS transporter [Alphaproteobacteria bacterium]|nr:MAG: 3-phenylpropionate MFS transporter [Alphaproteobacteria bacterium]
MARSEEPESVPGGAAGHPARYALFYGALFLTLGIYVPFWPLWLTGRELSPEQIGLVLALTAWLRVPGNPLLALIADRRGSTRGVLLVLAVAGFTGFFAFTLVRGVWPILTISLIAATALHALVPLAESQTMVAARRGGLDYGRVRLWGSLAFIAGTVGAGRLLSGRDPELVLILVLGALATIVIAAAVLPDVRRPTHPHLFRGLGMLLSQRRFVLFFGAATLLQSSHAVYYAFSAVYWSAAGHSEVVIGGLWAEGVVAEIALFAFGTPLLARTGPVGLMILAGAAGLVRWSVLGTTTWLPALALAQILHAATFAAAHLGAMHFIARHAPPGVSATVQAVYAALAGGLATGFFFLVGGSLYQALAGGAFYVMSATSAAGLILALALLAHLRRLDVR